MQADTMCLCSGNGMSRVSLKSSGIFALLQLHSVSLRPREMLFMASEANPAGTHIRATWTSGKVWKMHL